MKSRNSSSKKTTSFRRSQRSLTVDYQRLQPRHLLAGLDTGLGNGQWIELVETDRLTGQETSYSVFQSDIFQEQFSEGNFGEIVPLDTPNSNGDGGGIAEIIYGNDDRTDVTDPRSYPYSANGHVRANIPGLGWSGCSGALVGIHHFMTNAHCIYHLDSDGDGDLDPTSELEISIGRDGNERWYGVSDWEAVVTPAAYKDNAQDNNGDGVGDGDSEYDWALIRLDGSYGTYSGYLGYEVHSDSALNEMNVRIAGYPGDKRIGSYADETFQVPMWESNGNMLSPTARQLRYNGTLDTVGGMSGSNVLDPSTNRIVGIHNSGGWSDGTNRGVRMLNYIADIIADRRNTWTVTNEPDLVDWDTWFNQVAGDDQLASMSTTTVRPGDSFGVTSYPRNVGTASTGGNYVVRFYASTNATITSVDHYLGETTMASLNPFAWDTASISIAFPENIPDGTYNIGWIIDADNTINEGENFNNTGYIRDQTLNVIQPLPFTRTFAFGHHAFFEPNFHGVAKVDNTFTIEPNIGVAGAIDSYHFSVETNGTYEFALNDFGNSIDPVLAVYNADTGERIAFDRSSGPDDDSFISMSLSSWQRYIVAVGDWTGTQTGPMSLTITGDQPWFKDTVEIGDNGVGTFVANLGGNADTDFFQFRVPEGAQGAGSISVYPDSDLNVAMALFNSNGEYLEWANSGLEGGQETISLSGLNFGEVYIASVFSPTHSSSGDFTVEVDLNMLPRIGESNNINVNSNWRWVPFDRNYIDPVVVAGPLSKNNGAPATVRINDVKSNGFRIKVDEWDYQDGTHSNESVSYFVVEAGSYYLPNGTILEAGNSNVDHEWSTVNFQQSLDSFPLVLSQTTTNNGSSAVVTRHRNVDQNGFDVFLQEEQAGNQIHATENVSWIALGSVGVGAGYYEAGIASNVTHDDSFLGFSNFYDDAVFLATPQTFSGADPFSVRRNFLSFDATSVFLQEETSGDSETQHNAAESLGYLAMGSGFAFGTAIPKPFGETGSITDLTHQWQTVNLNRTFTNPVVIMGAASNQAVDPFTVRVRNVTGNSFQVQIKEWDYQNQTHGNESISFIVVEAGTHTLANGIKLRAGNVNVDHNWKDVDFSQDFSGRPAVFTQQATLNGPSAVITRVRGVFEDGFTVKLQEEEGANQIHAVETVGWLAVEQGDWVNSAGVQFEAGRTPQAVTHANYTIGFEDSFSSVPLFFAQMQTYVGIDPGNIRYKGLNKNLATVFIDEESSLDSETNHNSKEAVGYFAMEAGVVSQLPHFDHNFASSPSTSLNAWFNYNQQDTSPEFEKTIDDWFLNNHSDMSFVDDESATDVLAFTKTKIDVDNPEDDELYDQLFQVIDSGEMELLVDGIEG